jgi:tetratricopeptide (TPR) repeat protein
MSKTRRGRAHPSSPERPKRRAAPPPPPVTLRPVRPERNLPPEPPPPRPSHFEAVALYERGVEALQRRAFESAASAFRDILARYPEEREIDERARLYLKVCERELAAVPSGPQTAEERLLSATVALNSGDYEGALTLLRRIQAEDADNDHAEYMLAVIAAARGDQTSSLEHLKRAIELNPENRALARQDGDFENLRANETFRLLTEPVPGLVVSRRRRPRLAR